jgi:hypothetical protein
LDDW